MAAGSYLRFPHVRRDQVVFVAEDDVWLASTEGGPALRVTSDHVPTASPRISPDGAHVAWTAFRHGAREVYVAPLDGGVTRRLTFWGLRHINVTGWASDSEVLVASAAGQADPERAFVHAIPIDGSPARRLPYGWAAGIAFGPDGGVLLSTVSTVEPAWWKGYRGGTAGQLWLDLGGTGEFKRIFSDLSSSLVSPVWTVGADGRQRVGFCSDHDGRGHVYSAPVGKRAPSASRLVCHTDDQTRDFYARHASSDGRQVVYQAGGDLYLLESLDGPAARRLDIRLGGARFGRQPHSVKATKHLGTVAPDSTGRASALETRGTVWWLTHRDGPARALADGSRARRRLPVVLGGTGKVAWVSDAGGDDAIEVAAADADEVEPVTLVNAGKLGRVLEMVAAPNGRRIAVASHDGRLLTVAVPEGDVTRAATVREIDSTVHGDVSGLAFSPDSRWLAWSAPGPEPLRQIRIADLTGRRGPVDVTPLRFSDTEPVFTLDGKHLAFLSIRSLDPVYDAFVFDLSFPNGCRPHVVPLARETPSPFDPRVGGRPTESGTEPKGGGPAAAGEQTGASSADATGGGRSGKNPPRTRVELEGIDQRITAVPVEGGRYAGLQAVKGGLVWLRKPLAGELGDDRAKVDDEPARARVEHVDLATAKVQTLVDAADAVRASGNGERLVVVDHGELTVLPSTRKVDPKDPQAADSDDHVKVDLARVRVEVDPGAEWTQMYDEAWRLMRDHYWRADMGGVDWPAARDRYAPLLETIGSRDDLVDLIWELHGELGSSHAYCMPPDDDPDGARRQGLLGADMEFADGAWRVDRVVPGEPSERRARSPLAAAGVGVRAGDSIVAVDGRPTRERVSPGSLLVGAANKPVELTVAGDGGVRRRVVVVPLADEFPLRYQDWVNDRRGYVHARTEGRIGYLHVPDMVSGGWAQLHRDLRTEVGRDALILDVRGNRGGHTSQLVIEKLARRIIGWDLARGFQPESYPGDARRGPMVTVTDMYAGSDGDIVTAAIQSLGLGPVVGTRTWGGVVGIDGRYSLVDGTVVTQPRYSFWFERFGWEVENYGIDPDIEVVAAPHHRASGEDVQLDFAIGLALKQVKKTPALNPPPLPDL